MSEELMIFILLYRQDLLKCFFKKLKLEEGNQMKRGGRGLHGFSWSHIWSKPLTGALLQVWERMKEVSVGIRRDGRLGMASVGDAQGGPHTCHNGNGNGNEHSPRLLAGRWYPGALSKCITPHWAQVPHTAWRAGKPGRNPVDQGHLYSRCIQFPLTGLRTLG